MLSYLFVLAGGAAGAFVAAAPVSTGFGCSLQPVSSAPSTKPNMTIKAYILFIMR